MTKHHSRTAAAMFIWALAAALIVHVLPGKARADTFVETPGAAYATLGDAIAAGETAIHVTGDTPACDIPSGVSVSIEGGGSIAGDFFNSGSVAGASADNCGVIYDYTGTVTGGNVRVPGSAVAGVSEVRFAGGGSEAADYQRGALWIPAGQAIRYLIINDYVCTPSGGRIQYAITYLYNNAARSPMTLDAKRYPATYCVMTVDQTIPAAPDTETDYVFAGWYCATLGYYETNLQKTVTIPADAGANLTLVSWWTSSPGHNEGKGGAARGTSGGMSGGAGGEGGGLAGGISAMAEALSDDTNDENEAETLTDYSAGQGGGMRIRNANSTTRHTFDDAAGDIEARAARRTQKRFPWQWVGVGAGSALVLLAAGAAIRRRVRERNAATLEKLNIRD